MDKLTTTQLTQKRLKLHFLGALLMIVLGTVWVLLNTADGNMSIIAPSVLVAGVTWLIITKLRRWWHHS